MALLEARNMDPGEHGVYFGQLLGMADPLTYVLGRNGYRVGCPDVYLLIQTVLYFLRPPARELRLLCACAQSALSYVFVHSVATNI